MSARLFALARSMPMRLAFSLVTLFAVVSLGSLAASYAVTRNSLDNAMRDDLRQDIAGFRAAPSAAALAALVAAQARVTDIDRMVLSYRAPSGRHYGNAALSRDESGYHLTTVRGEGPLRGEYLALTTPLHGGQLTIARSRREIDELWRVFRSIVLLSLMPTILIALSGGLWLARRSARQVAVTERALDRMTTGNLAARVDPEPDWSDDLLQIGRKIDRMAAAQQTTVATLRQVSSDVAHDLKTPIQRVSVYLDELSQLSLRPEADDLIGKARAELERVVSVFHSLLQIAQVESGSPRSRFAPVDLGALADTVVELYEPAAAQSGHDLSVTRERSARYMVTGERDLLAQALANLIENALRHTPPGSAVRVSLDRGADVVLRVADTGPGIPADERSKVVQRLYRLDRSRNTPGSGLGLSLVAVVAELHGARLDLSDGGPGLVATLRFPLAAGAPTPG